MKHLSAFIAMLFMFMLPACDNNDKYDQLPSQIQAFVSQYYPGISVSSYDFSDGVYHVTLSDSAYLEFNSSVAWTTIDGRGSTLPAELIYDQMPPQLYQFLETTSNTGSVYSASRNSEIYTLKLLDSTAIYDIATKTTRLT